METQECGENNGKFSATVSLETRAVAVLRSAARSTAVEVRTAARSTEVEATEISWLWLEEWTLAAAANGACSGG